MERRRECESTFRLSVFLILLLMFGLLWKNVKGSKEARGRNEVEEEKVRVRELHFPTKVLKTQQCPLGYEQQHIGNEKGQESLCCQSTTSSADRTCIRMETALKRPITTVVLEVLNKTDRTVFRSLSYGKLPQSLIPCSNYDDLLLESTDLSTFPLPLGLETASGGMGPCIVHSPPLLKLEYFKHVLLGLPLLDAIKEEKDFHRRSRVLIIGLGGGALPSFLSYHFPQMKIDVVEIEPTTIAAARTLLGFKAEEENPENVKVYQADAVEFIRDKKRENGKYDLIIPDAFNDDYIPADFIADSFLQNLLELVEVEERRGSGDGMEQQKEGIGGTGREKDNGVLLFNVFCNSSEHKDPFSKHMPPFGKNFPSLRMLKIEDAPDGNCVLFAHNSRFGHGSDRDLSEEEERKKEVEEEDLLAECDEDGLCSIVDEEVRRKERERERKRKQYEAKKRMEKTGRQEEEESKNRGICDAKKLVSMAQLLEEEYEWAKSVDLSLRAASSPFVFQHDNAHLNSFLC